MKTLGTLFLISLSMSFSPLRAQKFFNNNFYLLNPYSYNTAYAGQNKELVAVAQFAGQNNGLPSSPRTNSVFVRKGFLREAGLGLRIIIDERGVFKNTRITLESSYRIVIDPGSSHYISLGVGGGANWENVNIDIIEENGYTNMNDPMLFRGNINRSDIQFGAGIAYQIQGFEVGISMPFILGLYGGQRDESSFWKYFSGSLGYTFQVGDNIKVQPFTIFQRPASGLQLYDLVVLGQFKEKYSLQLGYRSNGSLLTAIGLILGPTQIGYSTEIPFGDYGSLAGAAHSIMVGFTVNEKFFSSKRGARKSKRGFSPRKGKPKKE